MPNNTILINSNIYSKKSESWSVGVSVSNISGDLSDFVLDMFDQLSNDINFSFSFSGFG